MVVWFPDRFSPPEEKTREFFENWLRDDRDRTLIFVGRDFDAEPTYWQAAIPAAPLEQRLECRKRWAKSRADYAQARSGFPSTDCGWFQADREAPEIRVDALEGAWSEGIDAQQAEIWLHTRYQPSDRTMRGPDDAEWRHGAAEFRSLLESGEEILVGQYKRGNWQDSKIIVIANGSWLLNLPLVNHEHRKLAGRLIRACGSAENVVFLESGPGEPPIAGDTPNRHHGLQAFTVWPVNCILIHLVLLGIILCFSVFPIFGRPKSLDEEQIADFGKHIRALGALLAKSENREFARQRREYYYQRVSPESVVAEPPTSPTPTSPTLVAPAADPRPADPTADKQPTESSAS